MLDCIVMSRWLILAFGLGALCDHVFYQKTKALKEHTRMMNPTYNTVAPRYVVSLPGISSDTASALTKARDLSQLGNVEPKLTRVNYQEQTISPNLYLNPDAMPESALELAQNLLQNFGLKHSKLRSLPGEAIETENQVVFDFQQTYDTYDVYESKLRLVTLKENAEVLLLSNHLRDVQNFNPKINFDLQQAESIIQSEYARAKPRIYKKAKEAVVWPSQESELAWLYWVRVNNFDSAILEVAVGANSGKILMSQNASESFKGFTPNFDPNCLKRNNSAANTACIFYKNPAHSAFREYGMKTIASKAAPNLWHSARDGNDFQHHRVVLRDLDRSGNLQNGYLSVNPGVASVPPVTRGKDGTWRFPHAQCENGICREDSHQKLGQVSTYFWANELRSFMQRRTGKFFANKFSGGGKVRFNTSISNSRLASSYTPALRMINLYVKPYANRSLRWNDQDSIMAEQVLHEYGHANLHAASGVGTNFYPTTSVFGRYACNSRNACYLAISEGIAFLHSSIPFESPKIFEARSKSGAGSYDLNTSTFANKSATDAYSKVAVKGDAHNMGLLYASIWWNVRKNLCKNYKIEKTDAARMAKIDRLFSEHMPLVQLSDTIPGMVAKIAALSRKLKGYGNNYAKAFEAELLRRYSDKPKACY